jgi:tetratricopeptide (TPR) repeat protein
VCHPYGDFERSLTALREAEALAATLDDPGRLGQVSVSLSVYCRFMGAYDQAIAAGQRALALATATGEVVLHARASLALGYVYQAQGDYRRAIECYRQTAAFFDGARRRERFGEVLPAALSRAQLAACHAELGMFADGRALGDEALRIAEAVDHPGSLMWAYCGLGRIFLRQGNLPRALPLLERALGICQEADFLTSLPWMAAALGAAYTLCGRIADAVPLLTHAIDQSTAPERQYSKSLCSLPLGRAQLLAGRLQEAHALAEQALAHARAHQERGHQAYALHLLGDIAAHREPLQRDQAEAYYRAALTLADELNMRPLAAHCHLGLGTLYRQMGRSEEAHAALSTAIDLYRAMEMTLWLPQAEAALAAS